MNKNTGFTFVELMIVVAIIGILAAVAVPKFASLVSKSKEASVKHNLGALRSALTIYYSNVGDYPTDLDAALTTGEVYFADIPVVTIPRVQEQGNPGHVNVTSIKNLAVPDDDVATGVFGYNNANEQGLIFINCIHKDTKGVQWSSN